MILHSYTLLNGKVLCPYFLLHILIPFCHFKYFTIIITVLSQWLQVRWGKNFYLVHDLNQVLSLELLFQGKFEVGVPVWVSFLRMQWPAVILPLKEGGSLPPGRRPHRINRRLQVVYIFGCHDKAWILLPISSHRFARLLHFALCKC